MKRKLQQKSNKTLSDYKFYTLKQKKNEILRTQNKKMH